MNKVKSFFRQRFCFKFQPIDRESVLKKIRSLSASKVGQEIDVPTKVMKENDELFAALQIVLVMKKSEQLFLSGVLKRGSGVNFFLVNVTKTLIFS